MNNDALIVNMSDSDESETESSTGSNNDLVARSIDVAESSKRPKTPNHTKALKNANPQPSRRPSPPPVRPSSNTPGIAYGQFSLPLPSPSLMVNENVGGNEAHRPVCVDHFGGHVVGAHSFWQCHPYPWQVNQAPKRTTIDFLSRMEQGQGQGSCSGPARVGPVRRHRPRRIAAQDFKEWGATLRLGIRRQSLDLNLRLI
ncbi:hypothetical protein RJT34_20228 [Clitoria ternatea]|uniref:Uncharacterized protein n=1 Tax=Clitoria ternatea TaxID=43366 RepID=A0AAN9P4S1_CLITE